MKLFKKTLSLVLAIILISSCFLNLGIGVNSDKLVYNANGKFKILQITDTHINNTDNDAKVFTFVKELINYVNPDLVVLTGDIIHVSVSDETEYTNIIKKIVIGFGLENRKFSVVFGNHDTESGINRDRVYEAYLNCGALGIEDDKALTGAGNYNLPIYSATNNNKMVQNLWFFDSLAGNLDGRIGGYDYVREDQINWYKTKSASLQSYNAGNIVPSIAFQHIIVPEIYEIYYKSPVYIKDLCENYNGVTRSFVPDFTKFSGTIQEPPCPPYVTAGEFDAWVQRGDIMAAAFGHDHVNNFIANVRGIDLIATPGATYQNSYGSNDCRGARLFTLDENNPWSYDTEVITYRQLTKQPNSDLGDVNKKGDSYGILLVYLEVVLRFAWQLVGKIF